MHYFPFELALPSASVIASSGDAVPIAVSLLVQVMLISSMGLPF